MLDTLAEDVFYRILDLLDARTRASVILVNNSCNSVASVNWRVLRLTTVTDVPECLKIAALRNSQSMTSLDIKLQAGQSLEYAPIDPLGATHEDCVPVHNREATFVLSHVICDAVSGRLKCLRHLWPHEAPTYLIIYPANSVKLWCT